MRGQKQLNMTLCDDSTYAVVDALGQNLFVEATNSTLSQYILVDLEIRPSKVLQEHRRRLCVDFPGLNAEAPKGGNERYTIHGNFVSASDVKRKTTLTLLSVRVVR